jgi:ABC-type bacteriocin/lantibiotic exporter with double-glycine peptidase domain
MLRAKAGMPIKVPRAKKAMAAATAAAVAPPILNVPYVAQEQTEWCWAACTQMVAAYLNKTVKQCELANFLHGQTTCCATPGSQACNQPAPTAGVPQVYNHLGINCITNTWPVSAAIVVNELQQGRPVEIGFLWFGGGGHVAIIRGVTAQGYFAVNDPWFGAGLYQYQALYLAYGRGRWALTFGAFH